MIFKSKVAMMFGAALFVAAPAANLSVASYAIAAEAGPIIQAAVSRLGPSASDAQVVSAINDAVISALKSGVDASEIVAAIHSATAMCLNGSSSGLVTAVLVSQGVVSGVSAVRADASVGADVQAEANKLISLLSADTAFNEQIACSGGAQTASIGGQSPTGFTSFPQIVASYATGGGAGTAGYDPCAGVTADYCQ